MTLTITNVNRSPVLADGISLNLGTFTIGHFSTASPAIPDIAISNYNDPDTGTTLTQSCSYTGPTADYFTLSESSETYEITAPASASDSNDNAGEYTITCVVSDGTATVNFVYTIEALFNEPPTSAGSTISDKEIAITDTTASHTIDLSSRCTDPESDTLTH